MESYNVMTLRICCSYYSLRKIAVPLTAMMLSKMVRKRSGELPITDGRNIVIRHIQSQSIKLHKQLTITKIESSPNPFSCPHTKEKAVWTRETTKTIREEFL